MLLWLEFALYVFVSSKIKCHGNCIFNLYVIIKIKSKKHKKNDPKKR